tara:strand:- start:642 stop:1196 length:555 start_codon:yes stop_codon:yes gene_type:complete
MLNSEWPTHILHSNIKDTDYCQELFHYLISTYGDEWPNSFAQKDIFSHTDHKNPIFDKAQSFIQSSIQELFFIAFQTIPKHIVKTFATNHTNIGLHQHQGSLISGVFYVYCESGLLTLHDPRLNAQRGYPNELQKYFEPKKIAPKTGDIILFPSFLQHEVAYNLSKQPRVIMPFDVFGDQDHFG